MLNQDTLKSSEGRFQCNVQERGRPCIYQCRRPPAFVFVPPWVRCGIALYVYSCVGSFVWVVLLAIVACSQSGYQFLKRTLISSRHILISSGHASFASQVAAVGRVQTAHSHHTTLTIMLYTSGRGNGQETACFIFHSNVCGCKESVRVRRQQATLAPHDNREQEASTFPTNNTCSTA